MEDLARQPVACAIVPAWGGDLKGMPLADLRLLAGKPLIAHTIKQARGARRVSRLVVPTNDPQVAAVCREYGAEVVGCPAAVGGDTASPAEAALLHALDHLRRTEGYCPDLLVLLPHRAPLTVAEDIDGTVDALLAEGADTAVAVTPFHHLLWRRSPGGNAVGINHDRGVRPLHQGGEAQFLETGAVYVMRAKGFLEAQHRFFGRTATWVTPPERCLVISEPVDFLVAEEMIRQRQRRERTARLPKRVAALVMDFDGVMTDNRVLVLQDGSEGVLCHRGDGWGLAQLKKLGIPMLVLSTEENPVVQARCRKLGIECLSGARDKRAALLDWLGSRAIDAAEVVYVGNDVNDLGAMGVVGCPVVVADAHPLVLPAARLVLGTPGGYGAVRELSELIASRLGDG